MSQKIILLHIKDQAAKGTYRPLYERNLVTKLSKELKGLGHKSVRRKYQRIFIDINSDSKLQDIKEKLLSMKEINYFCFPIAIKNNLEEIKETCFKILNASDAKSFKPKIKISCRSFPLTVKDLTSELGSYFMKKTKKVLDFIEPEITIYVEVTENASYIYDAIYKQ